MLVKFFTVVQAWFLVVATWFLLYMNNQPDQENMLMAVVVVVGIPSLLWWSVFWIFAGKQKWQN